MNKEGKYLEKGTSEFENSLKSNVILPNVQRAASKLELIRWNHTGLIINPTGLDVPGWEQKDYHEFWTTVLSRYAQRAIFFYGWEYSSGCTIEFEIAQRHGIDCVDENLEPITLKIGVQLIKAAIKTISKVKGEITTLEKICENLLGQDISIGHKERKLYKDEVLDHFACTANVAQFVSFEPGYPIKQRYCRIIGYEPNNKFITPEQAISALLEKAPSKKVNIRSFNPDSPEGNVHSRSYVT
jgi:hypothetical protein